MDNINLRSVIILPRLFPVLSVLFCGHMVLWRMKSFNVYSAQVVLGDWTMEDRGMYETAEQGQLCRLGNYRI